jgi:purine-nucleoside phosphorylase
MSEQAEKIIKSSEYIKSRFPKRFKPAVAMITENNFDILKGFDLLGEVNFSELFSHSETLFGYPAKILFCKCDGRDVLVCYGRFHYYDGVQMRDIGHIIYTLKYLGIRNIVSVDEAGHLNPRFRCGEIALIYDHINLAGDNPLIGKNDNALGIRFPDMSNAYDRNSFSKVYKILQENFIKINESVLLGTIGPQSETDAEARFYREIGADIVSYSVVPENITAVHAGINFTGIGLITRELVADKMAEDERSEKQKDKDQKAALKAASAELTRVLKKIIKKI